MGLFSRLFGGRKGQKGEVLRKEALGRAALLATRRGPSRWLAEGIVRTHCETIEATRGIPADEVWAEFSAHLDMDELGAIYASTQRVHVLTAPLQRLHAVNGRPVSVRRSRIRRRDVPSPDAFSKRTENSTRRGRGATALAQGSVCSP